MPPKTGDRTGASGDAHCSSLDSLFYFGAVPNSADRFRRAWAIGFKFSSAPLILR